MKKFQIKTFLGFSIFRMLNLIWGVEIGYFPNSPIKMLSILNFYKAKEFFCIDLIAFHRFAFSLIFYKDQICIN